jgi:hypothetical protein
MKLLTNGTEYTNAINTALNLQGEYGKSVIFHCYWNGALNEKHLYSILSCYYFNVHQNKHKIILWLENNAPNQYNIEIAKYAEIRQFSFMGEIMNARFIKPKFYFKRDLSFYSDVVRYLLLHNYGGAWFDLDCFILRSFDPIFCNFGNDICVYQWESQNYPNGAIFVSLEPRSEKMRKNIEFIIQRNRGWGFQEAGLTYDLPLNMLVLPCAWFDAYWVKNPYNIGIGTKHFFEHTDKQYDFDNFFQGSFCYHWHNSWNKKIDGNSIIAQLVKIIQSKLQ